MKLERTLPVVGLLLPATLFLTGGAQTPSPAAPAATGSATLTAALRPAEPVLNTSAAHRAHLIHLAHVDRAGRVATVAVTGSSLASQALSWAYAQTGVPYLYGGIGAGGYDCSGLVMEAYLHAGVALPRDTYEMLVSSLLVRTYNPVPGDLAFYGSGHVELYVRPGITFGAQHSGTLVGNHGYGGSWAPTEFFAVR
jgi:cell wall-associated NlpC family hydrolase